MRTYGRRVVVDMPFEAALVELMRALGYEGVSVLSNLDVRDFLDRSMQHEFRKYALLDVAIAHVVLEALREDLDAGTILATSIAVFELADGRTAVRVADPFVGLVADPEWWRSSPRLAALADETCQRLANVLMELEQAARVYSTVSTGAPKM